MDAAATLLALLARAEDLVKMAATHIVVRYTAMEVTSVGHGTLCGSSVCRWGDVPGDKSILQISILVRVRMMVRTACCNDDRVDADIKRGIVDNTGSARPRCM
jgi:hypothetical protein